MASIRPEPPEPQMGLGFGPSPQLMQFIAVLAAKTGLPMSTLLQMATVQPEALAKLAQNNGVEPPGEVGGELGAAIEDEGPAPVNTPEVPKPDPLVPPPPTPAAPGGNPQLAAMAAAMPPPAPPDQETLAMGAGGAPPTEGAEVPGAEAVSGKGNEIGQMLTALSGVKAPPAPQVMPGHAPPRPNQIQPTDLLALLAKQTSPGIVPALGGAGGGR